MASVKLADIIEPEVFANYSREKATERSRLVQSGIVRTDPVLNDIASGPGTSYTLPFWPSLTGESEEQTDKDPSTPDKIQAAKDIAVKHFRIKSWAANDLAAAAAGADPMRAIADQTTDFWNRDMQKTILLPSLIGIFASALAETHVHDIADEDGASAPDTKLIGSQAILDALGKLGDHWDEITALTMHSAPFRRLQSLGLIETERLQDQSIVINRFWGREVLVDDGMPAIAGSSSGHKYTTYLYGDGAVGFGDGGPEPDQFVETDRDKLASEDILITRRHFILHPRGVAFTGALAKNTPTKVELATGANWTKKWEPKNIKIIKLVTNG